MPTSSEMVALGFPALGGRSICADAVVIANNRIHAAAIFFIPVVLFLLIPVLPLLKVRKFLIVGAAAYHGKYSLKM